MIESLYLSLLCLSAALLCYTGLQNYSLIRSISCSCFTCCFGLGFQHQNLPDFIKIIRALIKDIFLDVPRVLRLGREVAEGVDSRVRHQLAARRRLEAEREQAERQRKQRERAEKIRQQREEAEQQECEREEKRAQREREKIEREREKQRKVASKRVRHEVCSEGLLCNEPSKRARVASVVPKDPGPVSTKPPEESRRPSIVRKAPAHLADFVQ